MSTIMGWVWFSIGWVAAGWLFFAYGGGWDSGSAGVVPVVQLEPWVELTWDGGSGRWDFPVD